MARPADFWTVWSREKISDELTKGDSFDSAEVADEMAAELVNHHHWHETVVRDKDGVETSRHTKKAGRRKSG
jgi:hypothetical protein